ncbi:6-hydroxymethylpterin diphosphokinase MptE-like protein [Chitinivibrio alkaliphilus]|uniref:6-hydroxymethylpterin diphosphokinase MptE-like domain-containing protein n=1 Tax=Chitinivibrio alkaliphilus ACht1 TaxID=1313304 RepID=U7D7F3_9BACT|nr:6-hydroxymethylpterin diphosphokinase MptE-like protein [Chitinivibrio alkaliphilus]ERP31858.1 hypothetical protein CALK_1309 [Chitinivibrio alkaliphilus ACht1]
MILNKNVLIQKIRSAFPPTYTTEFDTLSRKEEGSYYRSFYSSYNAPLLGKLFAQKNFHQKGDYLVYGLGAGQYIFELLEAGFSGTLYLLETDPYLVKHLEETSRILSLLEDTPQIVFALCTTQAELHQFLHRLPTTLHVRYFPGSLNTIASPLTALQHWLQNRRIDLANTSEEQEHLFDENSSHNHARNDPDFTTTILPSLHTLPLLILMGGPSLHEALPYLSQLRPYFVLLSTSRNGSLLAEANILPDFWIDMDPWPKHKVWSRLKTADPRAGLIYLDTTSTLIHSYFSGKKYILYSHTSSPGKKQFP